MDEDDKLIWDLPTGTVLLAKKDMRMKDGGEQVFTAGKAYPVASMHPVAVPAYVVVNNDHGETHKLNAEHVREYFATHSPR